LQDTVALPEPATLGGVIAPQVSPDGTVSVRLRVAEKPFKEVTVMVAETELPAFVAAGELAAIA